jgi:hypothetical protein
MLLLLAFLPGARAEEPAPSTDAIDQAIAKGVSRLKSLQRKDGSYGPCVSGGVYGGGKGGPCYHLGPTAFTLFTLALCGVPRDDPGVERGLVWLRRKAARDYDYSSYESAAVVLMLAALNGVERPKRLVVTGSRTRPPAGSRFAPAGWQWLDERVAHLLSCQGKSGGFGYYETDTTYADVSATQFAALALRAVAFAGYPVPADAWTGIVEFHTRRQHESGGFPYHARGKPSRGMTAAALSSLIIAREQLGIPGARPRESLEAAIEKGFRYLDENFDVATNPSPDYEGRSHYHYCHLYAIERAGVLAGRHRLGDKGWYASGAAFLLAEQDPKGGWTDSTCMDPEDVLGTCFALLFLKKATMPAVTQSR